LKETVKICTVARNIIDMYLNSLLLCKNLICACEHEGPGTV